MFYVGQKVVCVDARARPGKYWARHQGKLVEGRVYTVARGTYAHPTLASEVIDLVEVQCNRLNSGDPAFRAARFRPVTDISDLQAIVAEQLAGKPRKIKDDQFDKQRVTR